MTEEQWTEFKRTIPRVDELPERVLAVFREEAEKAVAEGDSGEAYLARHGYRAGSFTVGQLIAELQKYPEDMPVFGWGESTEPELEQGEVPIPNPHLEVEEVAPVGSIWVLAEDWEDNLGKDEARDMFEAEPVKALLISWEGA